MEVRVCRQCKKFFQYTSGKPICPQCKQQEEEKFIKVRDYLKKEPGSTILQVSQATEVSTNLINSFLREGRLVISKDSPIKLECEACGTSISTGKFCEKCKGEVVKELEEAGKMLGQGIKDIHQRDKGMHYLSRDNIHRG